MTKGVQVFTNSQGVPVEQSGALRVFYADGIDVSVVYDPECGYNDAKVTGAALSFKERTSSLHRVMEREICACVPKRRRRRNR